MSDQSSREFIDGATAIVRGCLDAGCDFFAGYPITPASQILMAMMDELPRRGGVAIQAEDEIASIGMCIGAAMAGASSMTATSGPGISLYSENIGLAIMGEVPLVIVDVQRLGPSTGGATTVGQGDVQFVRWGTAGGYPTITLAPASLGDCYRLARQAFKMARRFRCPVFVLTDKELNLTMGTVAAEELRIEEGEAESTPSVDDPPSPFLPYRYDPPEDVPPLVAYGASEILRFTGSTHDERAFITKDPATVGRLNRHLEAKIEAHRQELELVAADLDPRAETLFLSYGVTAGAMVEALEVARRQGRAVSALTIQSLWPVPKAAIAGAVGKARRLVVAELNLGQYRREIERLVPDREILGLNRVDGELISPEQFLELLP